MIRPTIHRNGTSTQVLLDQTSVALNALNNAIDALAAASPNARDYYPQGEAAVSNAMLQHRDRIGKLVEIRADLEALLMHIIEQDRR